MGIFTAHLEGELNETKSILSHTTTFTPEGLRGRPLD